MHEDAEKNDTVEGRLRMYLKRKHFDHEARERLQKQTGEGGHRHQPEEM